MIQNTRREFLKSTIVWSVAASLPLVGNATTIIPSLANSTNLKILFQGDSITDGNRSKTSDWNHVMGHGYQYIISSKLWYYWIWDGIHPMPAGHELMARTWLKSVKSI